MMKFSSQEEEYQFYCDELDKIMKNRQFEMDNYGRYVLKQVILKHSKSFYGTMGDRELMKMMKITPYLYYRCKCDLLEDLDADRW